MFVRSNFLWVIVHIAIDLISVINDILDLSKLEENKMHLEEIDCPLLATVEEAVEVVSFEAEKKNLEIVCDIDPSVPSYFTGDQIRYRAT